MTRTASDVLDQEFLQIRAKILEIGAFFDRLVAAEGSPIDESKLALLKEACRLLCEADSERAAQIQLHFSRQYDENWRDKFGL